MIRKSTIDKLNSFNDSPFQILTVYLGDDSTQAPSANYLLTQFHSLTHKNLTAEQRTIFKDDIIKIEKFLGHYIPGYRSLVFFSAGNNLWQVAKLEFAMPASISTSSSPNMKQLTKSLESHSKYLVLLVDRAKSRMFTVEQGQITEQMEAINNIVPKKVRSTGRDTVITQNNMVSRRNDELLKRHVSLVSQSVAKFTKSQHINFVIIGGQKNMIRKVADMLPNNLQSKIMVGLVTDINAPLTTILKESKKIAATVD
jgi:hypothetical protein